VRGTFVCGYRDIDRWFREDALKCHAELQYRVVTAHLVGQLDSVVGFYAMTTLLESQIELEGGSRWLGFRPQSGRFSTVQLSYVAVHRDLQRQGYGTVLMGAVLQDFYEVVIRTGIFSLTLQAINRDVMDFYKRLGFVQYGNPHAEMPKMILPAQSVIETIGGSSFQADLNQINGTV
jgi:GNAT superfamily N-acetyltransferase